MNSTLKIALHLGCVVLASLIVGCATPQLPTTDRASAEADRVARLAALQARPCCDSWEKLTPITKIAHGAAAAGLTVDLWPFQHVGRFGSAQSFSALIDLAGAVEGDALVIWGHPNSDGQTIIGSQQKELESEQFLPRVVFLDDKRQAIPSDTMQSVVAPDMIEFLAPQARARVPRGAAFAIVPTSLDLVGQLHEAANLSLPIPIPVGRVMFVTKVTLDTSTYFLVGSPAR
jgi:hypothetical protein